MEPKRVKFPEPRGLNVNMMPVVMGDAESVPEELRGYLPLIKKCDFWPGSVVYLTVNESVVEAGETQRRPGIHTDAFKWPGSWMGGQPDGKWGGGWGGGKFGGANQMSHHTEGIYIASTDGQTRVWLDETDDVDQHGRVLHDMAGIGSFVCKGNGLYWLSDRTPHEGLPALRTGMRQFFRLVSENVGVWFSRHNTPNPLGVKPSCRIVDWDKFEE